MQVKNYFIQKNVDIYKNNSLIINNVVDIVTLSGFINRFININLRGVTNE